MFLLFVVVTLVVSILGKTLLYCVEWGQRRHSLLTRVDKVQGPPRSKGPPSAKCKNLCHEIITDTLLTSDTQEVNRLILDQVFHRRDLMDLLFLLLKMRVPNNWTLMTSCWTNLQTPKLEQLNWCRLILRTCAHCSVIWLIFYTTIHDALCLQLCNLSLLKIWTHRIGDVALTSY